MKTVLSIFLMLAAAGCATAPAQTYRPRNYNGPAWTIECKQTVLGLYDSTWVTLINSQTVTTAKITDWQTDVEASGQYEGHTVTMSLHQTRYDGMRIMVFVDGERAATF